MLGEAVGGPAGLSPWTRHAARRGRRGPHWPIWAVSVVTDSVRRRFRPSRACRRGSARPAAVGCGPEVIDLLAAAEVPRIIHIGCEAASFARDIGLYLAHGYQVEDMRVFDSFPLTHHIESVAVLTR